MAIDIAILKRKNIGMTNVRLDAVGEGLSKLPGVRVRYVDRTQFQSADLIIQHGFKSSQALTYCCDERKPYLIIEHPHWRREHEDESASFGYNGLGGMQFLPEVPATYKWRPDMLHLKTEGSTIIFAQKPNDHSLQGHDHVSWLKQQRDQYPTAEFRHHPLMSATPLEPLDRVLDRCHLAITYSSTVGGEALLAGCVSYPSSPASIAYDVGDREAWAHKTAWRQFSLDEFASPFAAGYIMSGFEEARERARSGLIQRPRSKMAGIMGRYLKEFGN